MAKLPAVAAGIVLIPSELVAVPFEVREMGETIERVTPVGAVPTHTGIRITDELKPFREPSVTVTATSWP